MFAKLHNIWEPLYAPESSLHSYEKLGNLQPTFNFTDETHLTVEGKTFERREVDCHVRGSGPDAWGYRLDFRKNTLFRWIEKPEDASGPWYMCTADESVWIEQAGKSIETIRLTEDEGNQEWILYHFVEW